MAKIKGYELKKVETWTGREGYGLNADIHLAGKKIGRIEDDAGGGEVDLEFISPQEKEKINVAATAYFKETGKAEEYDGVIIEEFINAIFDLKETEKHYKRMAKKGLQVMVSFNEKGSTYVAGYYTLENAKKACENDPVKRNIKYYESSSFDIK